MCPEDAQRVADEVLGQLEGQASPAELKAAEEEMTAAAVKQELDDERVKTLRADIKKLECVLKQRGMPEEIVCPITQEIMIADAGEPDDGYASASSGGYASAAGSIAPPEDDDAHALHAF